MYWLMERIPAAREGALRLGLVTLEQMLTALVAAVESPCKGTRVLDVPGIRKASMESASPVSSEVEFHNVGSR
jgi:hypothetical protein